MLIRAEKPVDFDEIDDVVRAAFGKQDEVDLVHRVRALDGYVPELALVAADFDGAIVGHVMLSYATPGRPPGAAARTARRASRPSAPRHRRRAHARCARARRRARRTAGARPRPSRVLPALRLRVGARTRDRFRHRGPAGRAVDGEGPDGLRPVASRGRRPFRRQTLRGRRSGPSASGCWSRAA